MTKTILLIYICLLCKEVITATAPVLKHQTHPKPTKPPGNNRLLKMTTKRKVMPFKNSGAAKSYHNDPHPPQECVGWCLQTIQDSIEKSNGSLAPTRKANINEAQEKRFSKIRSFAERNPYFLVRVGMTLFADRKAYDDHTINRVRAQLFHKNVIQVPSEIFYPYMRTQVKSAVENSGFFYDPNKQPKTVKSDQGHLLVLFKNLESFSNSYFEHLPGLRNSFNTSDWFRKYSQNHLYNTNVAEERAKHIDLFTGRNMSEKTKIKTKLERIADFVNSGAKRKSRRLRSSGNANNILGVRSKETMMESPGNEVDDIVGGMKIMSKDAATIVVGTTNEARRNLDQWLGRYDRGTKANHAKDVGIVLEKKTKAKAIDNLLQSMLTHYQYQIKKVKYKKQFKFN